MNFYILGDNKELKLKEKSQNDKLVELNSKIELQQVELTSIKKLHNERAESYFTFFYFKVLNVKISELEDYKMKNRELTMSLNIRTSEPAQVLQ